MGPDYRTAAHGWPLDNILITTSLTIWCLLMLVMTRQIENKSPWEPGVWWPSLLTQLIAHSRPPAVCPGSPRCGSQGSHEHHKPGPADAKTYKYLKLAKIPSQLHNYCRGYKLFWRQADGDYQPFGHKKVHLEWVTITEMETVKMEISSCFSPNMLEQTISRIAGHWALSFTRSDRSQHIVHSKNAAPWSTRWGSN